jgi:hypothetical protein
MAQLRSLSVSGEAEFANPPEQDEQPIRRREYLADLAALQQSTHAPVTAINTKSIGFVLVSGTQNLSANVRRKITGFSGTEGAILETNDGLVVKLGLSAGAAAPGAAVADLITEVAGKAPLSHTHSIANVTGLQDALDGKAAASHTHSIANVTGLQTALDGKAPLDHTHAAATPTAPGFLSATDKARLDSLVAASTWLPAVPTKADLPLNTDPINAMRVVMSEGTGGSIYRHISNIGFVDDQWAKTFGFSKSAGTVGDGVHDVLDFPHNLGTEDIGVTVRLVSGTKAMDVVDWAPVDPNTVRLTFGSAPTSGGARVIVFG